MPLTVDIDKFNPWPLVQEHVGNLIAQGAISGNIDNANSVSSLDKIEKEFVKALTIAFAQGVRYANIQQSKYYPVKPNRRYWHEGTNAKPKKRKR